MPTVEELAADMGIDLATAKPEGVTKFRTFVADTNKQYTDAKALAAQAEANLAAVQKEQDEINTYIAQYGTSEEARAATEANLAAYKAAVENLKAKGITVDVPELKVTPAAGGGTPSGKATFDPDKFRGQVGSTIADLTDLNNKHIALTGQPLPDRSNTLAEEARKAGQSLYEYGAKKYDFAGKEKAKADAAQAAHDAEVAAKAVADWKAKNPNVSGDPNQRGGVESANPFIKREKVEGANLREFSNMNPRQKIAASVARSREAIAAAQS